MLIIYADKSKNSYSINSNMRIQDLLLELADRPYNYRLTFQDQNSHKYRFYNEKKLMYYVFVDRFQENQVPYLGVMFQQVDPTNLWYSGDKVTGTGDAYRVFATVAKIINDDISHYGAEGQLIFAGEGESRNKLYDRIAKNLSRYVPMYQLDHVETEGPTHVYYFNKINK